ncbi:MAG: glycosyltransferase [Magnetococcales bacterium]|nr:glycosyltransferase [Magnetococcales bacterium]
MKRKFGIVTAVYNDWECLQILSEEINKLPINDISFDLIIIDDGSISSAYLNNIPLLEDGCIDRIYVEELVGNIGNQRALCVGLKKLQAEGGYESLIVMDVDGEDRPAVIPDLIKAHDDNPGKVIVCRRVNRTEGKLFKIGYFFYKNLFSSLTGTIIDFGNFSLIPKSCLGSLVSRPELWQHFSATIIRSRIPYYTINADRGTRFYGKSSQHIPNLLVHGLNGISVFSDVALARVLLGLVFIAVIIILGMFGVIGIRFLTDLAILGWASNVFGFLAIALILIVFFAIAISLAFMNLAKNTHFIPKINFSDFFHKKIILFEREENR